MMKHFVEIFGIFILSTLLVAAQSGDAAEGTSEAIEGEPFIIRDRGLAPENMDEEPQVKSEQDGGEGKEKKEEIIFSPPTAYSSGPVTFEDSITGSWITGNFPWLYENRCNVVYILSKPFEWFLVYWLFKLMDYLQCCWCCLRKRRARYYPNSYQNIDKTPLQLQGGSVMSSKI